MTIHYDGHGAPITETIHEPYAQYWPRTETTPAEVFVQCVCGDYEFTSQESAGGGVESWGDDYQSHVDEAVRRENGDPES